jgi:hypothetical protein
MLRVLVAVMLAVAPACDKTADAPATQTSAGPVGTVVDVTGKVSATRGTATRSLAKGGEVFGDDVIETAADASIAIVLAHNNARWSLEPGMKERVDGSIAWKLERQELTKPVEHATSAAGREAEKRAAETKESVSADTAVDPMPSPDVEEVPKPPRVNRAPTETKEPKKDVAKDGGGGCDEVGCLVDDSRPC